MIQINNFNEQFSRAAARAAAGQLTVEPSTLMRQYRVRNNEKGVTYRVDFFKTSDGRKFVTCECAGGQSGRICKHAAAALPVHLQTMRENHAAAVAAADKAFGDFEGVDAAAFMRQAEAGAFDDADDPDADINNWQ